MSFAGMGLYPGEQAEFLRVPDGDFNGLLLPRNAQEKENDCVRLADILPTGYHATELAQVKPGDTVVIYGAGPVAWPPVQPPSRAPANKTSLWGRRCGQLSCQAPFSGITYTMPRLRPSNRSTTPS